MGLGTVLRKTKRRIWLLVVVALMFSILAIAPAVLRRQHIPGSDRLWDTSQPYQAINNESFTVVFQSVDFTFLYEEEVPLDVPIPIHFRVTFSDSAVEYLTTTIGGLMLQPPRVVMTDHTSPQVAIVSAYGDSNEEWCGWYYAVSID